MSTRMVVAHGRTSWSTGKARLQALVRPQTSRSSNLNLNCFEALHEPYVLAFEPAFVEIRHIETGLMSQVIQGTNLRLLFADTPPSVTNTVSPVHPTGYQQGYDYHGYNSPNAGPPYLGRNSQFGGYGPPQYPNQPPPRNPQGIGRDEILIVSDERVLALRTAAGPQRHMSDNASMMSMPR
jgi:hypothetical protein